MYGQKSQLRDIVVVILSRGEGVEASDTYADDAADRLSLPFVLNLRYTIQVRHTKLVVQCIDECTVDGSYEVMLQWYCIPE